MAKKAVAREGVIFEKKGYLDGYRIVKYPMRYCFEHYSATLYDDTERFELASAGTMDELIEQMSEMMENRGQCEVSSAISDFFRWYRTNPTSDSMNKLRNFTWRIIENIDSGTYVAEMAKIDPHGIKDWSYVDQGCTLYELLLNLENFDPDRRCTDNNQRSDYYDIMRKLKENIDELGDGAPTFDDEEPKIRSKWFQLKIENSILDLYSKGRLSGDWKIEICSQTIRDMHDDLIDLVKSYDVSDKNGRERAEDLMDFIQKFNQMYRNSEGVFESDLHFLQWLTVGGGFQLYTKVNTRECKKYCKTALEMLTYLNKMCKQYRFSKGPEYASYSKLADDLRDYLRYGPKSEVILSSDYYRVDQHPDGTYILMARGYGLDQRFYQEEIAPDLTGILIKARDLTDKFDRMDARQCEVRNDLVRLQKLIEDKINDNSKSAEYDCYGSYNEEKCSGSSKCLICAYEHDCIKRSAELLAQKPKPTSKRTHKNKAQTPIIGVDLARTYGIQFEEDSQSGPLLASPPAEDIQITVEFNKEDNTMNENRKSMMDRMVSQFYPQEIPAGQVGLTMNGQIAVRRGDGDYVRYNPATEAIENQMDFVLSGEQMDKMCILMPTAAAYLSAGDIIKEKQTYYQVIEISGNRIRSVNLNSSVTASLKIETNILTGQKMYQKVYSLFSMMQSSMMGGGMLGGMGMNPMMMAMVMDKFKSSEDKDDGEGSMADMLMPMMCMGMMNPSMMGMVPQNQQNAHEAQTPTAPAMGMNPMMNPMMMAMFMSKGSASDMMLPMMCMGMMGQGGQPMMAGNFCTPTTPVEEVAAESGELNNHSGENYGSTED